MDSWTLRGETDAFGSLMRRPKWHNYGCFQSLRTSLSSKIISVGDDKSRYSTMYRELNNSGGGGGCCRKLLNGHQNKVILYAEESWAQTACSSHLIITWSWWRHNNCTIEEVSGYRKYKAKGEIILCHNGSLVIRGSFSKKMPEPDFKLTLTSNIERNDFNMGYCLTGHLERGANKKYQTTHFAVVKKSWPNYSAKGGFRLL